MDQLRKQFANLECDIPVIQHLIIHGIEVIATCTAQLRNKKRRYARSEDSPWDRIPRLREPRAYIRGKLTTYKRGLPGFQDQLEQCEREKKQVEYEIASLSGPWC